MRIAAAGSAAGRLIVDVIGLIKNALSLLLGLVDMKKDSDATKAGQDAQARVDQAPAIDGAARIDQSNAQPHDTESTRKRLGDGTF